MPTRALARFVGLTFTFAVTASVAQAQPRTVIAVDPADKAAAFGAADLSDAIARWRVPVTVVAPAQLAREAAPNVVVVTTETAKLPGQPGVRGLTEQGYAIRRVTAGGTTRWWAIGHDPAGAMYAALELAEAARSDGHLDRVVDRDVNPFIVRRGIKFNIPLDARTPSYSDDSTSGQANIPEMWDMGFWTRFLDEMARHRYNVLSLWSLSPFPSLVKVPEYPKVALADVKRKTGAMFDATNQGRNMYDPSWPLETVRTMTIDEKIAFWRGVMQYARESRHRRQRLHLEHLRLRHRGQRLRAHRRSAQRDDEGLRPHVHPRAVQHLPAAHGDRRHLRREHGRPRRRRQGAVDVGDVRPGREGRHRRCRRSGQPVPSSRPPHHADPSRPSGGSEGDRRDLQGAARQRPERRRLHAGVQLQVLAGAHAQLDRAAVHVPERLVRLDARRQADLADGPQRRLLLPALGRSRFRARLLDAAPAAAEDRRLHARARRLHLGPRLRQWAGNDAAAPGHREAVVLVHALGPAGL